MTLYEIGLLAFGIIFLLVSFFVGNNETRKMSSIELDEDYDIDAEEIIEKVKQQISEKVDAVVEDATSQMEHISNEKIMAVNEFSDQIMERISHNHEEVLFMYNMIQNKEEQIKKTASDVDKVCKEAEQVNDIVLPETNKIIMPEKTDITFDKYQGTKSNSEGETALTGIELAKRKKKAEDKAAAVKEQQVLPESTENKESSEEKEDKVKAPRTDKKRQAVKNVIKPPKAPLVSNNKNDEILKLYRQKKSIIEISKTLGLGQGEVKLVIDLYGHK